MKLIILMTVLLFTVACKSEKKTVKESCTINGVSRPMEDCRSETNPIKESCTINGVPRPMDECRYGRNEQRSIAESLRASVTFAIDLQPQTSSSAILNVLENAEDVRQGRNISECGIKVTAGDSSKLTKIGSSLRVVDHDNEQHILQSVGRVNGFIGTWRQTKRGSGLTVVQTVTIHSQSEMSMTVECSN